MTNLLINQLHTLKKETTNRLDAINRVLEALNGASQPKHRQRSKMSAAIRKKISLAQKARWAKIRSRAGKKAA